MLFRSNAFSLAIYAYIRDLLKAFYVANLSAAIYAYILDLLRAF